MVDKFNPEQYKFSAIKLDDKESKRETYEILDDYATQSVVDETARKRSCKCHKHGYHYMKTVEIIDGFKIDICLKCMKDSVDKIMKGW